VDPYVVTLVIAFRAYHETSRQEQMWDVFHRLISDARSYKSAQWITHEHWVVTFLLRTLKHDIYSEKDFVHVWENLTTISSSPPLLFHLAEAAYLARFFNNIAMAAKFVETIYERVVRAILDGILPGEPGLKISYRTACTCILVIRDVPEYASAYRNIEGECREILMNAAVFNPDDAFLDAATYNIKALNRPNLLSDKHFGTFMTLYNVTVGRGRSPPPAADPIADPELSTT
jgi:hypothetical protein